MAPVKWVLTREIAAADREARQLAERGVDVLVVPCITFEEHPWPTWKEQPGSTVVLITSKRAAQAWLESGDRADVVAAMAPSTSEFLLQHGARVDVTARGGVIALAESIGQTWRKLGRPAWHFRYPTSDAGLERNEQTDAISVLATMGPVERHVVYQTRAVAGLAPRLEATMPHDEWGICFASPSAVDAFLDACPKRAGPSHVVCFGRSTAEQWDERHPPEWRDALLTASVVDTVVSLEERP